MDKQQIKAAIVDYMTKNEIQPNWKSIGVNHETYELGVEAYKELRAEGVIETVERISPKGRKMRITRLVQK